MTETHSHTPEHKKLPTAEISGEAARQHLAALKQRAESDSEAHTDEEILKSIKVDVDNKAVSKEDFRSSEANSSSENSPTATYVSRELKQMGFRRNLTNARLHMRAPSRAFSKAIHQPVVEKISDYAAPTIARPSGIIGGGIFALLGSAILLYITKHYGYRYNYLVFIVLFVGGFIAGMIVELIIRAVMRHKHA